MQRTQYELKTIKSGEYFLCTVKWLQNSNRNIISDEEFCKQIYVSALRKISKKSKKERKVSSWKHAMLLPGMHVIHLQYFADWA